MEKMRLETKSGVEKNIEIIGALFPNCIEETKDKNGKMKKSVNFELLKQMLSDDVLEGDETYDFSWVGKKAAIVEANKPSRMTLRPFPNESIEWDLTENLFIEGDNLEVLKLLQESYLHKIKMIYIDPPYNTGNDFIYKDDFGIELNDYKMKIGEIDEEGEHFFKNTDSNGRFHSDWCSMIYSRLLLARNFLSHDGVIFISIDDNEYKNLRNICDIVFGESMFIASLCVEMSKTQGMKVKAAKNGQIVKNHEYILVYGYQVDSAGKTIQRNPLYRKAEPYDTHYDIYMKEDGNRISLIELIKSNMDLTELFEKAGLEITKDNIGRLMTISPEFDNYMKEIASCLYRKNNASSDVLQEVEMEIGDIVRKDKYILIKNSNGTIEQLQPFSDTIHTSDEYIPEMTRCTIRGTWWNGFYSDMLNVEKEGRIPYKNGKKPIRLIKQLAKWANVQNGDIVLDFFAGSATTGHAIMQYNKENGTNVKTILVQLPENLDENIKKATGDAKNSIAESIKILDQYKKPHYITELAKIRLILSGEEIGETNKDLDRGFRVFKLAETNMKNVYYDAEVLTQADLVNLTFNIKEDRTALDLLFGCLLEWGLPLSLPYTSEQIENCTIHTYNNGDLIACFNENIPDSVIKKIALRKPLRAVFRDSSFANSSAKINVGEVFKLLAPDTRIKVI